jgi:hypothetical protein
METIHAFENAGLGKYPFVLVGVSEKIHVAYPGATPQPAGTCDYCGTGIKICCHIQSADGKEFIVGSDCVAKTGDEGLKKVITRTINAQRSEKKLAAQRAARELVLDGERERNGGKTDAELTQEENDRIKAEVTTANKWLIDVLDQVPYASDFVAGIKSDLNYELAPSLSENVKRILSDIYAKTVTFGARRNSAEYNAATKDFFNKVDG